MLNAYIVETPEKARADGEGLRCDSCAQGEGGALEGIPLGIKDLFATKGVHTQAASHILDGFKPPYESTVTANLWRDGAVMLGKLNMDEFAMGSSNETSYLRQCHQSVAAAQFQCGARAGRLVGRLGGGGGRASLRGRDRDRHRRVDPPAGGLHRDGRHQADLWPLLALGDRRLRVLARPGGADRPRCARCGDHAAVDGEPRPQGLRPRSTLPVPDYEAALGRPIKGLRVGIPQGIPRRQHAAPISMPCGQRGAEWLKEQGRRDRRDLAAAHQICVARLLHRGAGRGVVQSRAL